MCHNYQILDINTSTKCNKMQFAIIDLYARKHEKVLQHFWLTVRRERRYLSPMLNFTVGSSSPITFIHSGEITALMQLGLKFGLLDTLQAQRLNGLMLFSFKHQSDPSHQIFRYFNMANIMSSQWLQNCPGIRLIKSGDTADA